MTQYVHALDASKQQNTFSAAAGAILRGKYDMFNVACFFCWVVVKLGNTQQASGKLHSPLMVLFWEVNRHYVDVSCLYVCIGKYHCVLSVLVCPRVLGCLCTCAIACLCVTKHLNNGYSSKTPFVYLAFLSFKRLPPLGVVVFCVWTRRACACHRGGGFLCMDTACMRIPWTCTNPPSHFSKQKISEAQRTRSRSLARMPIQGNTSSKRFYRRSASACRKYQLKLRSRCVWCLQSTSRMWLDLRVRDVCIIPCCRRITARENRGSCELDWIWWKMKTIWWKMKIKQHRNTFQYYLLQDFVIAFYLK